MLRLCACLFLGSLPLWSAAEAPQRTLLVEVRHVPAKLVESRGVEAGPGKLSFDSYKRDRVLSAVRDTVTLLATREELEELRREGLEATILMESADKLELLKRAYYGPSLRLDPVYHSYDQIVRRAEELARAHPRLVHRTQIGETTQFCRPIYAYRMSNDATRPQERPGVLFNGCHHADELVGAEIVLALMEKLAAGYAREPEVTQWLDTLEIWLVPVINVDGHDIVTSGRDPRWRKNARDVNGDGVTGPYPEGVDVNRGYDFNWLLGGSQDPAEANYRGEFPFSEAENRAVRRLADEKQFLLSVSYHSQGEIVFYPWGWSGQAAPDDDVIRPIAADLAAHLGRMDGTGHYAVAPGGAGAQSYPWLYGRRGVLDFIVETGKGSHIFPAEEVPAIVAANLRGARTLLRHAAGPGLAVRVTDAISGAPLEAQVWLPKIDNEMVDRRLTDARFGRRWRLLVPHKYQVIISREGYRTLALRDVEVRAEGWTPLEVKLQPEK